MSHASTDYDPPLAGVRVIDLSSGPMAAVGRLLADLGADVTQVALHGINDRGQVLAGPDGIGVAITRLGIGHRAIDPQSPDGQEDWRELLAGADVLIESTRPGSAAEAALDVRALRADHPALVILSVSDFGRSTSYRDWQGSTPVFHALTSELSRSGIPGRDPLVPPGELPYHAAAAQAAVMTVSVFLDRLRTGQGDLIDFAVLEGAMQALDPPFGMTGSAAAGVPLSAQPRGRPEARQMYPIIACEDGYARICVLSKRQWRGMFEWMGAPAQFADPRYDDLRVRFGSPELLAAIAAFFAGQTRAELEAQGQAHGVPTAAVLSLDEALATEQVTARGFLRTADLGPGLQARVPAGVVEIDGRRASTLTQQRRSAERQRARHAAIIGARERTLEGRPLEGVRVLDFGVIVVGGDTGRLFGDLGAEVIKVENSAFPDGSRGAMTASMLPGFAAGHRNKRAIGINLRDPEGRQLVRRLAALSDIVLTNFKPGTIETLGLDYQSLKEVNPGIVVVDSSAFGPTGPWSRRLGYGPLVRAAAGFTDQWVYPGEPGTFSDAITVYPDHVCARIGALAALSLLIRRERTGAGGSASIAQSEVMLSHMATLIAGRDLESRGHSVPRDQDRDTPWGLFPAAGEDEWIAVTVRDDADWAALCTAIERPDLHADPGLRTRPGRAAAAARIDAAVAAWTSQYPPVQAMETLQRRGVPAGAMLRAIDLPSFGYYQARRAFREELHPHATGPYVMENVQIHSDHVADPPLRQAPLLGEQTAEIATSLLGLSGDEVADLIARGVLEAASVPPPLSVPEPAGSPASAIAPEPAIVAEPAGGSSG